MHYKAVGNRSLTQSKLGQALSQTRSHFLHMTRSSYLTMRWTIHDVLVILQISNQRLLTLQIATWVSQDPQRWMQQETALLRPSISGRFGLRMEFPVGCVWRVITTARCSNCEFIRRLDRFSFFKCPTNFS